MYFRKRLVWFIIGFVVLLSGYNSSQVAHAESLTPIMGSTQAAKEQMIKYLRDNNPGKSYEYGNDFVSTVMAEANAEGVRADVAFAQMMQETGFLKFGNDVQEWQNNFVGLGATGDGTQGASFPDIQTGIRAAIQHLKAWATTEPLKQAVVDPRYDMVKAKLKEKGNVVVPYVEWLGIPDNPYGIGWAKQDDYGYYIVNKVNTIKALFPMLMTVDFPDNGSTISNSTAVSGWALNVSGLESVVVHNSNGTPLNSISTGFYQRPDVDAAFQNYPKGLQSGFKLSLNTTLLPNGPQTIKVAATGKNGESLARTVSVNVANLPMRLYVDGPRSGSSVRGSISVAGWALNVSGLKSVAVQKSDGSVLGKVTTEFYHRPDVAGVFPGYPTGNGFSFNFDTRLLANGPQTLKVVAVGNNGETTSWNLPLIIDNTPKLYIDTPGNGAALKGKITLAGWALNKSGLQSVAIQKADGSSLAPVITKFSPRPDVAAVFPGYPGGEQSGFATVIDTTLLPNGLQTIKVVATGKNNETITKTVQINVANLPARMYVDTPGFGSTLRGSVPIAGWAVNISGVQSIAVYNEDGSKLLASATEFYHRPDVAAVFPGYPSGNGFSVALDTKSLPNGPRTITVVALGINGERTTWNVPVKIDNTSKMYVDYPRNGTTVKGKITVAGWALHMSGLQSVAMQNDAGVSLIPLIKEFYARPDVAVVFPGYPGLSGFAGVIDTTLLPNGPLILKVTAKGENGETITQSIKVTVSNPPARLYVDSPVKGSVLRGSVVITGWALNASGLKGVAIKKQDGSPVESAAKFYPRPDVAAVFPGYPGENGFSITLDTNLLNNGSQTIKVVALGNNGQTSVGDLPVIIDNVARIWIDSPASGASVSGSARISGWALLPSGLKSVVVQTAGGSLLAETTSFSSRPDVNLAFPGYPNGNLSGFSVTLETTVLPFGSQTIIVSAVGNNNERVSWNLSLKLEKVTVVLDPGHGGSDPGAISPINGLKEKDVNMAVAQKVREILTARGIDVIMTRYTDINIDLAQRTEIANASAGDLFVSIHANSLYLSPSLPAYDPNNPNDPRNVTGVLGTYFDINSGEAIGDTEYDPIAAANWQLSLDLADKVAKLLAEATSQPYKLESHSYRVLDHNRLPATLVELGFLTNPATAAAMTTPEWQNKAATAIADGIRSYLSSH